MYLYQGAILTEVDQCTVSNMNKSSNKEVFLTFSDPYDSCVRPLSL